MRRLVLAAASALAAAGCWSGGGGTPTPTPTTPPTASGLHQVHDPGRVTGTLTGPCHSRDGGRLPDPFCTPGAYDPEITARILCAPGYSTRSYRPPSSATARFKYQEAYPAYGLADPASGGPRTELDHLVSLELGGANDASNLWPESPPTPNPKDAIENRLHAWVCSGGNDEQVRLTAAQEAIASDWETAEAKLGA